MVGIGFGELVLLQEKKAIASKHGRIRFFIPMQRKNRRIIAVLHY